MGRSEEKEDWLGNKYTEHYDDDGNKTGESRDKEDWLGNKYTEHTDSSGDKVGESRDREDWLGNKYTEHTDSSGDKVGESRDREDWLGNKYTEHTDSSGDKTGESRDREDWLGNKYVEHSGSGHRGSRGRSDDDDRPSGSAGGRSSSSGGGGYSSSSSNDSGSVLTGLIIFFILAGLWLSSRQTNDAPEKIATTHITETLPSAVVTTGDKKPGYCYGERSRLQRAERVICDSKVLSSLDMATYDAYIVKKAALQGDFQATFVERHKLWVKMWHREARKLDGQALKDYLENQFRQHIQEIQGP